MAYANTVVTSPDIRMPSLPMPKLRWPRLSQRTRALLMMGIMVSPCFLSDAIGYCVERFFFTADEIAVRRAPDEMLKYVNIFHVACPNTGTPTADQSHWAVYAVQHSWPLYPEAGAGCFKPDRDLRGAMGLITFNVACPMVALSAVDQRRWVAYAANHDWAPYPQAGAGCVDP
jgi:hypothetical protein